MQYDGDKQTTPIRWRSESGAGSGDVRSTDWLFGAGVRLGVGYSPSDIITLEVGVDYQHLGSANQSVNGKPARRDWENVTGFSGGVRWRF